MVDLIDSGGVGDVFPPILRDITWEGRSDVPDPAWLMAQERTLMEIAQHVPVIGDPTIYGVPHWNGMSGAVRGVVFDLDKPEFDIELPAYGDVIADYMEKIASFMERNSRVGDDGRETGALAALCCAVTPDFVSRDADLSAAAKLLEPLLQPSAWKPTPSDKYYRHVKNSIVTPYISMVNGHVLEDYRPVLRVLVVGSWSGADIQRIAIARKGLAGLTVDTFDPYASEEWSYEFRQIVRERYGSNVLGKHFSCGVQKFAELMRGHKYDLVLAANSLHQFLNNVEDFSLIVETICSVLDKDGILLGMYPTVEGFAAMEAGRDTCMLNQSPPDGQKVKPYGSMLVKVANVIIDDPILPPEVLVYEFSRRGLLMEVMPAISAENKYPTPHNLAYGPESRGFMYLFAQRRSTDARPSGDIGPIVAVPTDQKFDYSGGLPSDMYMPRDVGETITLDDAHFIQHCRYFVAEKTDGVGSVFGVYPDGVGGAVIHLRIGPIQGGKQFQFTVPRYTGSAIAFEGEFVHLTEDRWLFDAFGLRRYGNMKDPTWYPGMLLLSYWLESQHRKGLFQYVGIKKWSIPDIASFERIWSESREGVVFKYVCAPAPRTERGSEIGTAKYLKKIVTYDVQPRITMTGWDPPVHGLPATYVVGSVVECALMGDGYHFLRIRHDRISPNSDHVIRRKKEAVSFERVKGWMVVQRECGPLVFDKDNPYWAHMLRALEDLREPVMRVALAATGTRRLLFRDTFGVMHESVELYNARAICLQEVLDGQLDPYLHNDEVERILNGGTTTLY